MTRVSRLTNLMYKPIKDSDKSTVQPANLRTWQPPEGLEIDAVFEELLNDMKVGHNTRILTW